MKETPISNHPIRAGIAAVTAVAACAGVGYYLSQTTYATRDSVSSGVEQLAYYLPGSMTAEAGLDAISDTYYYTAKVSINQVDLATVQEELANNLRQALTQTTTGIITTRTTVYSQPNGEGEVVCHLAPGAVFTAPQQEAGEDWYEIYWDDLCGYVAAADLRLDLSEEETAQLEEETKETYQDSYGTLTEAAVIYTEEDEESEALLELGAGETLVLSAADHGWYTVVYQGSQGYVLGDTVAYGADKPEWKIEEEKAALRQSVVDTAKEYMGRPYVYGASGPSSFDCSGFTSYIMKLYGVTIPRTAASQLTQSSYDVSVENLLPGDLVFFRAGDSSLAASHVGLYIGNGQFIHASSGAGYVTINNLSDSWYNKTYVGARRVL